MSKTHSQSVRRSLLKLCLLFPARSALPRLEIRRLQIRTKPEKNLLNNRSDLSDSATIIMGTSRTCALTTYVRIYRPNVYVQRQTIFLHLCNIFVFSFYVKLSRASSPFPLLLFCLSCGCSARHRSVYLNQPGRMHSVCTV